MRCKAPYVGGEVTGLPGRYPTGEASAICPVQNIDPLQMPIYNLQCTCPIPAESDWETGYTWNATNGWICATGYVGVVEESCDSSVCGTPRWRLSGCLPLIPCVVPVFGDSDCVTLNFGPCDGLYPGAECELRCKEGYSPNTTSTARCPAGNTAYNVSFTYDQANCTLEFCPIPSSPPGYVLARNTPPLASPPLSDNWQCAWDWRGNATGECTVDERCDPLVLFDGCKPLAPCARPRGVDECVYDTSRCGAVMAGTSCEVHCQAPGTGLPVNNTCHPDNVDPRFELPLPELPECSTLCVNPMRMTEEYTSRLEIQERPTTQWVRGNDSGWNYENVSVTIYECARGYFGNATPVCSWDRNCTTDLYLSQCFINKPCAAPTTPDLCMYDVSACGSLAAGEECLVWCQTYECEEETLLAGLSTEKVIEDSSITSSSLAPYFTVGGARLDIQSLFNVGWCASSSDLAPWVQWDYGSVQKIMGYRMLGRGDRRFWVKTLKLAYSLDGVSWTTYRDRSTTLQILNGSQDMFTQVNVALNPLIRARYVRLLPQTWNGAACMRADFVGCANTPVPFAGEPTRGFCSIDNVDDKELPTLQMPRCELSCKQPEEPPYGFNFSNDSGVNWECAEGFTGAVEEICTINVTDSCLTELNITGCEKKVPCQPLEHDPCQLDGDPQRYER